MKRAYVDKLGLPEAQIRFFDELTPGQVMSVRHYFTEALVDVDLYVYGVKKSGELIDNRTRRDCLAESQF